jgi:8-oxo-dGTP diphosphatase
MSSRSPLHVAVAVLRDAQGRILLSRRPQGVHLAGLWEFPGGKLEAGESVAAALLREIHEELGVTILSHRPLIQVRHSYAKKHVLLDVHLVEAWQGVAVGMEGQQVAWLPPERLGDYPMPDADRPIMTALRLPCRYLITPPQVEDESLFLQRLEMSLRQGVRLLQLRLPGLAAAPYAALALQVLALCRAHRAQLMVKHESVARQLGCGLHLTGGELLALKSRSLPSSQLLAASCHNRLQLQHAAAVGVDFATLSPVQTTASHPQAQPLGWQRFASPAREARLPVFALGGMRPEHLQQAWRSGAQGIAAIRGLL